MQATTSVISDALDVPICSLSLREKKRKRGKLLTPFYSMKDVRVATGT